MKAWIILLALTVLVLATGTEAYRHRRRQRCECDHYRRGRSRFAKRQIEDDGNEDEDVYERGIFHRDGGKKKKGTLKQRAQKAMIKTAIKSALKRH